MSGNYLYHYDTEFHNMLSSDVGSVRTKGGRFKDLTIPDKIEAIGKTGWDYLHYADIISKYMGRDHTNERSIMFFLEPIPDDVAKLFNNKHEFWKSGKRLYEYKVELSTWVQRLLAIGTFPYRVGGSPEVRDLIFNDQNWGSVSDSKEVYKYNKEILRLEKRLDYYGIWGVGIKNALNKAGREGIKKSIEKSVSILTDNGREKDLYNDRAPFIPHLLIYPGFKPVSYDDYREITLK